MNYKHQLQLTDKQVEIMYLLLERIIEDWEFYFDTDSESNTTQQFEDLYGNIQKVLRKIKERQ